VRKLEEAQTIWREVAPAPTAATLVQLTERGEALRSVITASS
jgi:DNA-binding HxlR family transcriptional regulator